MGFFRHVCSSLIIIIKKIFVRLCWGSFLCFSPLVIIVLAGGSLECFLALVGVLESFMVFKAVITIPLIIRDDGSTTISFYNLFAFCCCLV
jgi:hypothetical protein